MKGDHSHGEPRLPLRQQPPTRADGMSTPLFLSLNSVAIASEIRGAQHSVCYAAPGIQPDPANAMAELARRIDPEFITVCLDFDENVMRMGFGDLVAVKTLRDAGIVVNSAPGLRTGGSTPTQLQDCLRQLHLPTFRENCHAQAVLADREGVSFAQYLLHLCEMALTDRRERRIQRRRNASKPWRRR